MPAAKGWIDVNDQYCKGCELCISACPPEVMELDMSRLNSERLPPRAHIQGRLHGVCYLCHRLPRCGDYRLSRDHQGSACRRVNPKVIQLSRAWARLPKTSMEST